MWWKGPRWEMVVVGGAGLPSALSRARVWFAGKCLCGTQMRCDGFDGCRWALCGRERERERCQKIEG